MTDDIHYVTEKTVVCDGNSHNSALGHPREYLHLNDQGQAVCPYCSRLFIYESTHTETEFMPHPDN